MTTIITGTVACSGTTLIIFIIIVLLKKYNNPEKKLLWCIFDCILVPIRFLKLGPFEAGEITIENIMKQAMKQENLTDFGDTTFVQSYNLMMNTETQKSFKLSNIGKSM